MTITEYGAAGLDLPASDYEPGSPEQMMEERIVRLVDEMDALTALTMDREQRPLVQQQAKGVGQALLRAKLILANLEGSDVAALRRLIDLVDDSSKPLFRGGRRVS